jgi:hypothetical protein
MIFFRAPTFGDAVTYLGGILNPFAGPFSFTVTPLVFLLNAFGLAMHAIPSRWLTDQAMRIRTLPAPLVGMGLAALILIIDAMRFEGVAPFIYYRF